MPYKRRRYSRRRPYARAHSALSAASKALTVAYGVKKLINVERKAHTLNITTSPATAGSVIGLSQIAQGDTFGERNGNSILVKSIQLRGHFTTTGS